MASIPRFLSIWFALHLSVGVGLMALASVLLEGSDIELVTPLLIGVAGALLVATVLVSSYPELDGRVVLRFGLLTSVLFVGGNIVIPHGIYAASGEGSLLTIGVLWVGAMGVAFGLVGRGYSRVATDLDDG